MKTIRRFIYREILRAVAFVAVVLSTVNVFGGFAVTHRMLAMFRKD